eukprot:2982589-Pleurochrysis_carterae.AAC.1
MVAGLMVETEGATVRQNDLVSAKSVAEASEGMMEVAVMAAVAMVAEAMEVEVWEEETVVVATAVATMVAGEVVAGVREGTMVAVTVTASKVVEKMG